MGSRAAPPDHDYRPSWRRLADTDLASPTDLANSGRCLRLRKFPVLLYCEIDEAEAEMEFIDLFRPKWKHSDPEVRREAVKKLTRQALLAKLVKTEKSAYVRLHALTNLTDEFVLAEISKTDTDPEVRQAAVKKLVDQAVLVSIAKQDKNEYVREAAIKKLSFPLLMDILRMETDKHSQCCAMEALHGEEARDAVPLLIEKLKATTEVVHYAAKALGHIVYPDLASLPGEVQFRVLVATAHCGYFTPGQPDDTHKAAVKMGRAFLPILEEMIIHNDARGWAAQVLLNALLCYELFEESPTGRLRDRLRRLSTVALARANDVGNVDREYIMETAKRIVQRAPLSISELIQIVGSAEVSAVERARALQQCRSAQNIDKKALLNALFPLAKSSGSLQIEAIEMIGALGPAASSALPALKVVAKQAGRPVTREDFKEQEAFLGGLRESAWDRIEHGAPVAPDVLSAANSAIEKIRQGKMTT